MKIDVDKLMSKPRNHESYIKAYLDYTTHLEAPTEYHVWTAISMIAGALGGKCFIDMGYFRWKPNCFIIFVAPPGIVAKSTTSGVGTDILRNVPGVNFGPGSCTWQALLGALEEVTATYEIDGEREQMSCLTLEASELGTFLNFQDSEMIDVIVDLWDGKDKPLIRRTIGGGSSEIQAPWINLIACTTPSWITQSMPRYSIGGGFTSRCIFVYAEEKGKLVAYPSDFVPKNQSGKRRKLIEDMTRISQMSGAFKLSKEAKEYGVDWYLEFNKNKPDHLKDEQLAGYAARKQTHLHKIAMCLSASRGDSKIIEMEDMVFAMSLLGVSEQNMVKVFNNISDDQDATNLQVVKGKIKAFPKGVERQDLYRELSSRMSFEAFTRVVNAGVSAGYFENVVRAKGNIIRPTDELHKDGKYVADSDDIARVEKLKGN